MRYRVSVVIERDEHGYFAYSPELKGCYTQGDTLDEVMANVREAVALYVDTLSEEERASLLSREVLTTAIEVGSA
jgi:predicted RNase H-like HicB family nuclease